VPAGSPLATRRSASPHAPPPRRDRASSRRPRPPGAGPSSETTGRKSPPGSCPGRPAGPRPAGESRWRSRCRAWPPPGTRRPASPDRDRGRRPLRTAEPMAGSPFPARSRHRAAFPARQGPGCGRSRQPGRERKAAGLARNSWRLRRKGTRPSSRSPSHQMPSPCRQNSAANFTVGVSPVTGSAGRLTRNGTKIIRPRGAP
jgi:hypothetical protein